MATDTIDTRVAVLEKEIEHVAQRLDRDLATKADVEAVRADLRKEIADARISIIVWTVSLVLAQPVIWLGIIAVAKRTGLLDIMLGP